MQATWIQDMTAATDQWRFLVDGCDTYGYIHNYAGSNDYCWQAIRGGARVSGITKGREASMAKAEEMLSLPVEDFNVIASADLLERLHELEREIVALQPCSKYLPGYRAGYEAGAADVKRRISYALDNA